MVDGPDIFLKAGYGQVSDRITQEQPGESEESRQPDAEALALDASSTEGTSNERIGSLEEQVREAMGRNHNI